MSFDNVGVAVGEARELQILAHVEPGFFNRVLDLM
jgi:hypothetical protein